MQPPLPKHSPYSYKASLARASTSSGSSPSPAPARELLSQGGMRDRSRSPQPPPPRRRDHSPLLVRARVVKAIAKRAPLAAAPARAPSLQFVLAPRSRRRRLLKPKKPAIQPKSLPARLRKPKKPAIQPESFAPEELAEQELETEDQPLPAIQPAPEEPLPDGHPECTEAEECIGSAADALVQHHARDEDSHLYYPADVYCWSCWEYFKCNEPGFDSLVFMLAREPQ